MLGKALLSASVSAPPAVYYVEDVFSTWLYTGNGSTQTITNGIDLSGKGGLVWIKARTYTGSNALFDTERGTNKVLSGNSSGAQNASGTPNDTLTAFNSTGFSIGPDSTLYGWTNYNEATYASWTFRKAAKFFDVVTYTGTGSAQAISHALGSVPGFIVAKRTDNTSDWIVYHRSRGATKVLTLNSTGAEFTAGHWDNTTPTSTQFYVGGGGVSNNTSGGTYVAYLFAHDAGGFGTAGTDSVMKCGSFTVDGSDNMSVNLGWEPQWFLYKRTNGNGGWFLNDTMRGLPSGSASKNLLPNAADAESNGVTFNVSATGISHTQAGFTSGEAYIYIAIRRGPMKTPTVGTTVFALNEGTGSTSGQSVTTNFPVDMDMTSYRTLGGVATVGDRMRGYGNTNTGGATPTLRTSSTAAESTGSNPYFYQAWNTTITRGSNGADPGGGIISYFFRRAPGFFDVVAYSGGGTSVNHNLGVVPELMFVKVRSTSSRNWVAARPGGIGGFLNTSDGFSAGITFIDLSSATTTTFPINGNPECGQSGQTYIAYLFATLTGISKVGSYTGTGTTLNVDCGFTAGSRLVLIKRTDSTGNWYIWDSARGIVSGNDPYLLLNSTAAEVTSTDYIDPLSSGFQISSTAPAEINASGGSYIFLAVA